MLESLQIVRQELRAAADAGNVHDALPDNYLSVLFECARLLNRRFDARLVELGFTRNQWLVLNTVGRRQGLSQTEIADATALGVAALGKLLDALEKSHWIERRADPRDRRTKRLYLTRRAQNTQKSMRLRFEDLHSALEHPLGSNRKQHLVNSLGWIRQRLIEETVHGATPRHSGAR
jgi:DNA-binding MarR family transcriptional regulator